MCSQMLNYLHFALKHLHCLFPEKYKQHTINVKSSVSYVWWQMWQDFVCKGSLFRNTLAHAQPVCPPLQLLCYHYTYKLPCFPLCWLFFFGCLTLERRRYHNAEKCCEPLTNDTASHPRRLKFSDCFAVSIIKSWTAECTRYFWKCGNTYLTRFIRINKGHDTGFCNFCLFNKNTFWTWGHNLPQQCYINITLKQTGTCCTVQCSAGIFTEHNNT